MKRLELLDRQQQFIGFTRNPSIGLWQEHCRSDILIKKFTYFQSQTYLLWNYKTHLKDGNRFSL